MIFQKHLLISRIPCLLFRFLVTGWMMMVAKTSLPAQQPAFHHFGEAAFRGVQIYDMIQDKDLNYWFATSEGLYIHDYHTFEKVRIEKAKSISVFSFVNDGKGSIYCHNLNKQVFRIRGRSCSLFYELADSASSADISLAVADNGNLVIGARVIVVTDSSGNTVDIFPDIGHYLGPAFTTPTGALQFHESNTTRLIQYSRGVFSETQIVVENRDTSSIGVLRFFMLGGQQYAIDLKSGKQYKYQPLVFLLEEIRSDGLFQQNPSMRVYETGDEIWFANTLRGVELVTELPAKSPPRRIFEDYFISNVYKDEEGNYLLNTFDDGTLVIPDMDTKGADASFNADPITSLYTNDEEIYLGSSGGSLSIIPDGNIKVLSKGGTHPVQGIYGSSLSDLIFFGDGTIRAYNKRSGVLLEVLSASLKDAAFVSGDEFYLGTNAGIYHLTWDGKSHFEAKVLESMAQRVYALEYNPADRLLYASTANGFHAINSAGAARKIKTGEQDIFTSNLFLHEGEIFASTREHGILRIREGQVKGAILPKVNGREEVPSQMIVRDGFIFGSSSSGLFQFDMEGNCLRSLHVAYGFPTERVLGFTFYGGQLWVSHSGGLQQIDLDQSADAVKQPTLRFDQILVNDSAVSPGKPGSFSSDERKIQFIFSSPTLRAREAIRYYHRLLGYDAEWKLNDDPVDQVTYNALSPGHYTFEVKAEIQGKSSEVQAWSFTIRQPFYARGWFIVTSLVCFMLLVFSVYRRQLSLQRKKAKQINELNASRLTAIQSQMNPHFIFNSLNSIQDLILKGDVEHSYSYITTFSNLVRRTLSYSEKEFIGFEEEVELLELYLSLEKLRFKKDLHYEIRIKGNMDDIQIPPLLIQPFIENALVHGLLHKKGEKHLIISFELNEVLLCTIEDNGVGREHAKRIQQRKRSEHESFSGKAIRKRLEILDDIYRGSFGFSYEDLMQGGEPSGTKVTLRIPVKQSFLQ